MGSTCLHRPGNVRAGMFSLAAVMTLLAGCGGGGTSAGTSTGEGITNSAPVFVSDVDIFVPEHVRSAMVVTARDPEGDPLRYSIEGGMDAERFSIDSATGELRFSAVPDYEAPQDDNANNIYVVVLAVSDGLNVTSQAFTVSVTNAGLNVSTPEGHVKTLRFSWAEVNGAERYALYVNPDGISGYTQVGDDVVGTSMDVTVPVHLTDWVNGQYFLEAYDASGVMYRSDVVSIEGLMLDSIGYFKASNAEGDNLIGDLFGRSVAISANGNVLVVGAEGENSAATGIDGDQDDNTSRDSGAVYVYTFIDGTWRHQAYIKASNTGASDRFGYSVALSADGTTLAVGARWENSAATGVNGDPHDDTAIDAGAVYVFTYAGGEWTQQAYIKASNTDSSDWFGERLALSADGSTLAVGAFFEDSAANGIDGRGDDDSFAQAGAVYVFSRVDDVWAQQAYVKSSNPEVEDWFGESVALSADGQTLAVGATGEDSGDTGLDGDGSDNSAENAGAVYLYGREGGVWTQQAYLKASNTDAGDWFGLRVALSGDGHTLAVSAPLEDSATTAVDGDQADNSAKDSGAVYIFSRQEGEWSQQAYIKAANAEAEDEFGSDVVLSADGNTLVVSATWEAGSAKGVNGDGDPGHNEMQAAGAVYIYQRVGGVWAQRTYIKAPNSEAWDQFGSSLALSADVKTLAVGARFEDSAAQTIGGDQHDNSAFDSGAVYLY